MAVTWTRKGYYRVSLDDVLVSQHVDINEAYESIFKHAEANGSGVYRVDPPWVEVAVPLLSLTYRPGLIDSTAPSVPQSVAEVSHTETTVTIEWAASTDDLGVVGYRVLQDGAPVGTTGSLTYQYTGLTPSTEYSFTVEAYDAAGNYSGESSAVLVTTSASDQPYSPSTWGGVINTEALHESVIPGTNNDHFVRTWSASGGWNGGGYMRWRIAYTQGEDDDGYDILHPALPAGTRGVYLSWMQRHGSTWMQNTAASDHNKYVMFYPVAGTNPPRPTIFDPIVSATSGGPKVYRTWGPDVEAGGAGYDEFGVSRASGLHPNYPNHQFKWDASASDWYFIVAALLDDRTSVWVWTRTGGQMIGSVAAGLGQTFYARSPQADAGLLSSWNSNSFTRARLLAYIEATTAGDSNSYVDIADIRLTQTLPSPPAGYLT